MDILLSFPKKGDVVDCSRIHCTLRRLHGNITVVCDVYDIVKYFVIPRAIATLSEALNQ